MNKPVEIKVKRKVFSSALDKTSLSLPAGKTTYPYLSQVLLEYTNEKIKLTATDLKKAITTSVDYHCESEGSILFPGKLVSDILRKLNEEEVSLFLNNNQLIIKTDKSSFSFQLMSVEEFPIIPFAEDSKELKISQSVLSTILKQGLFSASREVEREGLSGALLTNNKNLFRVVSTDGHRLSVGEGELISFPNQNLFAMISAADLRLVEYLNSGEDISIRWDQKQVDFIQGNTHMTFKLLGAKFPPYEEVIPRTCTTILNMKTQPLLQSLDRLTTLNQHEPLKFAVGDLLTLTINVAGVGEGVETVEAVEFTGNKLDIFINPRYFVDALKNSNSDTLFFGFNSSQSPILITNQKIPKADDLVGGYYLALIMPMQI